MGDHGYYDENWDLIELHGKEVWGRSYREGDAHMASMPRAPKMNLEKALKDLAKQQATVQALLRQTQRFPDEFPVGTVLKFKHTFESARYVEPKAYDYVALRAGNGFWYLTCSGSKTMTWENLLEFIGDEPVVIMNEGETV